MGGGPRSNLYVTTGRDGPQRKEINPKRYKMKLNCESNKASSPDCATTWS